MVIVDLHNTSHVGIFPTSTTSMNEIHVMDHVKAVMKNPAHGIHMIEGHGMNDMDNETANTTHHFNMNMMDNQANMAHSMMKMYFNFDTNVHVLFSSWIISTPARLVGTCIAVFIMALFFEALKVSRAYLIMKSKHRYRTGGVDRSTFHGDTENSGKLIFNGLHILQSLLQMLYTTIGMWLMLVYMTFNVWLILSLTLGSGVGYFLFAWKVCVIDDVTGGLCH